WTISGGVTTLCTSNTGPTTVGLASTYTCSITATNVGNYTANFTYPGDSHYIAVSAGPQTVSPGKLPPTVSVTVSPGTASLGNTQTYTATVTGVANVTAPWGSVTTGAWAITGTGGTGTSCSSISGPTVLSSTATTYTCTVTDSNAGTYIGTFTYPGDSNYSTKPWSSSTTTVAPSPLALNAFRNVSSAFPNTSLVFTGTITFPIGGATPTGLPTFTVTGGTGRTCTTTFVSTISGVSTYTCTFTALTAGTYYVTFGYGGDSNYIAPSSVQSNTTSVSQSTPTVSVTGTATGSLGNTLTFTATVSGINSTDPTPTGGLTWTITCTAGVTTCTSGGPSGTNNIATYTCAVTASKAGTYVANFSYPGDGNYLSNTPATAFT